MRVCLRKGGRWLVSLSGYRGDILTNLDCRHCRAHCEGYVVAFKSPLRDAGCGGSSRGLVRMGRWLSWTTGAGLSGNSGRRRRGSSMACTPCCSACGTRMHRRRIDHRRQGCEIDTRLQEPARDGPGSCDGRRGISSEIVTCIKSSERHEGLGSLHVPRN